MASEQRVLLVTIRLTDTEIVINPAMQNLRLTRLDGNGNPMGGVEEVPLLDAISFLREVPHA